MEEEEEEEEGVVGWEGRVGVLRRQDNVNVLWLI